MNVLEEVFEAVVVVDVLLKLPVDVCEEERDKDHADQEIVQKVAHYQVKVVAGVCDDLEVHEESQDEPKNLDVADYVLKKPRLEEQIDIDRAISCFLKVMPKISTGDINNATMELHTNT